MDALLRLLMGPWTTYILWVLHSNGPTRFGELKRRVTGISAKMLTERLRMLEDSGVVDRNHQPTVPPQVTYSLTARGQELRQVLDDLSELARRWQLADAAQADGLAADGVAAGRLAAASEGAEAQSPEPQPAAPQARSTQARSPQSQPQPQSAATSQASGPAAAPAARPMVPAAE